MRRFNIKLCFFIKNITLVFSGGPGRSREVSGCPGRREGDEGGWRRAAGQGTVEASRLASTEPGCPSLARIARSKGSCPACSGLCARPKGLRLTPVGRRSGF